MNCHSLHKDHSGAIAILIAVLFPLFLAAIGFVIDLSRLYAAQNLAQRAADAALLNTVSTAHAQGVSSENFNWYFNANFPKDYLSTSVILVSISAPSEGVYTATITLKQTPTFMQIFHVSSLDMSVISEVSTGYKNDSNRTLELAVAAPDTVDIKAALSKIFGDVSVMSYDAAQSFGNANNVADKALILVSGAEDDAANLCAALKANHAVTLYVVDYGSGAAHSALQACATNPQLYFHPGNSAELEAAFARIMDAINFKTMHLTR